MAAINIRRLDDEVVGRLNHRAEKNNRSLEGEARHIMSRAAEDDMTKKPNGFRDLSIRLQNLTKDVPQTPSHILIREDRDRGHRDR